MSWGFISKFGQNQKISDHWIYKTLGIQLVYYTYQLTLFY